MPTQVTYDILYKKSNRRAITNPTNATLLDLPI